LAQALPVKNLGRHRVLQGSMPRQYRPQSLPTLSRNAMCMIAAAAVMSMRWTPETDVGKEPSAFTMPSLRAAAHTHVNVMKAGVAAQQLQPGNPLASSSRPGFGSWILMASGLVFATFGQPMRSTACKSSKVQLRATEASKDEDFEDDDEFSAYDDEDFDDDEYDDDEDYEDDEAPVAVCKARFLQGSPIKYRRVLWQIRGRSYRDALMLLEFMPWRACKPTLKALQSAAANAQNHFNMDKSRLYVKRCLALKGPVMKRMRPVSKGQAHGYVKKTTHLHIYVAEMEDDVVNEFS